MRKRTRFRVPVVGILSGILFLLLFPVESMPLDPAKNIHQYRLETWKTGSGLPDNSIIKIMQAHDGYLWLATTRGLVRFDGVRFKVFDSRNTPQMKSNYIRHLYQDGSGVIWIGTDAGLLTYRDGEFKAYSSSDGLPHNLVRCVSRDSRGVTWIGTYGGGLARFKDGQFKNITTRDGLSDDFIRCLCEDRKGNLWVGTRKGLSRYKNGSFRNFDSSDGLSGQLVSFIFEDKQGHLWIGTDKGLNRMSEGKFIVYTARDGLPDDIMIDICPDSGGNLWIGTAGGLVRFKDRKFSNYTTRDGLPGNIVYSVLEDREGSLWFGTLTGGLGRLKDVDFTTFTNKEGLAGNVARCVLQHPDGTIWVGTSKGLSRRENQFFKPVPLSQPGVSHYIASMTAGSRGCLYVGGKGWVSCGKNDRFRFLDTPKEWGRRIISSIREDKPGKLWVGVMGGGLYRFENSRWRAYKTGDGLSGSGVKCLSLEPGGDLWIGTQNGLNYLNTQDFTFSVFTTHQGLSDNEINCMYRDSTGTAWIGTRNGLTRLRDGVFIPLHHHELFMNNGIYVILEDDEGFFWFSSNKGIFRVSRKDLNGYAEDRNSRLPVRFFDEADGMQSRICNGGTQPAGWKDSEGKLWFPTVKGVVTVDPGHLEKNTQSPPVYMEEVLVDGEVAYRGHGEKPSAITLEPGAHRVEFQYTALSYLQPEKAMFKFRLDGYDTRWVHAGSQRMASYTNLSPGDYVFRVIACNNDGLWNLEGAAFSFYLKPHFYQTPWFYLLWIILVVTLAVGFYRWRVRSLKRHRNELEDLVSQRTNELQQANLELEVKNKELQKLATLDGLTGIHNYRWFSEVFHRSWRQALRDGRSISILLIDVDFFKLYNDTYGHQDGDECLKKVASRIDTLCQRPGDAVARYGGEEFIVMLAGASGKETEIMAERIRKGINELKIPHRKTMVDNIDHITISIGGAVTTPTKSDDPAKLVQFADVALYQAKAEGRNRNKILEK